MLKSVAIVACAVVAGLATAGGVVAVEDRLAPQDVVVARAHDGHFRADVWVGHQPVTMLIDTGASTVVLTRTDALRLGLELGEDDFTQTLMTAAGPVAAAPVTLPRVGVGALVQTDVPALVVTSGLSESLLGMAWLGRLSRIETTPQRMRLEG